RSRTSRMAYRMLCYVDARAGRNFRPPRRRRRPHFPSSRKRDRAVRGADRQAIRSLLVSCSFSAGRRGENVQEPWQLLYPERLGSERAQARSEEHTSELQSRSDLVCRLLLEKKK